MSDVRNEIAKLQSQIRALQLTDAQKKQQRLIERRQRQAKIAIEESRIRAMISDKEKSIRKEELENAEKRIAERITKETEKARKQLKSVRQDLAKKEAEKKENENKMDILKNTEKPESKSKSKSKK